MKIITFLICILLMFVLPACNAKEAPAPIPTDSNSITESTIIMEETVSVSAETDEPTIPPAAEGSEIPKAPIIETKYYTLSLPDEWKEICHYSVVDGNTVTLREKASYESFGGGKLCTIMMMPTDDDTYQDFPDYELLCALDTPDGSFYVIALFPTDVQFDEDTADIYNTMMDELMSVLWGIEPMEGIEMAMP